MATNLLYTMAQYVRFWLKTNRGKRPKSACKSMPFSRLLVSISVVIWTQRVIFDEAKNRYAANEVFRHLKYIIRICRQHTHSLVVAGAGMNGGGGSCRLCCCGRCFRRCSNRNVFRALSILSIELVLVCFYVLKLFRTFPLPQQFATHTQHTLADITHIQITCPFISTANVLQQSAPCHNHIHWATNRAKHSRMLHSIVNNSPSHFD